VAINNKVVIQCIYSTGSLQQHTISCASKRPSNNLVCITLNKPILRRDWIDIIIYTRQNQPPKTSNLTSSVSFSHFELRISHCSNTMWPILDLFQIGVDKCWIYLYSSTQQTHSCHFYPERWRDRPLETSATRL
jgi:hypothetical protein